MHVFIALLRGINIGNKNKILMKDLRELFSEMHYPDARTYIQTGNVVFSSKIKEDTVSLSRKIEQNILEKFGINIPVLVISFNTLRNIMNNNPFVNSGVHEINHLHLTLLDKKPLSTNLAEINKLSDISSPDQFKIIDKQIYICCPRNYAETKLGNNFFEKKLQVKATTRNWKTVSKIYELALK